MKFIAASKEHSNQIVELLKITLGESLIPKTVDFWNWKHNENPFGQSKTILAFDNEKLIGVRAFMCWQFSNYNEIIKCVRAVDTAVHPNYQGKGVFSKLTLAALDNCKKDNISFVFNTPNKISKIGYLKLGWVDLGRLSLRLSIPIHIPQIYNVAFLIKHLKSYEIVKINEVNIITASNKFLTQLNADYLNWRYVNCPIGKYYSIAKANEFIIIFRLKKVKSFTELRLCEVAIANNKASLNEAISRIKEVIKIIRPVFVSCANIDSIPKSFYRKLCFFPSLRVGPVVTLKNINATNFEDFKNYKIWQPTLGCMELF
jgi:GNAT superfamily N-acetyltransferase